MRWKKKIKNFIISSLFFCFSMNFVLGLVTIHAYGFKVFGMITLTLLGLLGLSSLMFSKRERRVRYVDACAIGQ